MTQNMRRSCVSAHADCTETRFVYGGETASGQRKLSSGGENPAVAIGVKLSPSFRRNQRRENGAMSAQLLTLTRTRDGTTIKTPRDAAGCIKGAWGVVTLSFFLSIDLLLELPYDNLSDYIVIICKIYLNTRNIERDSL